MIQVNGDHRHYFPKLLGEKQKHQKLFNILLKLLTVHHYMICIFQVPDGFFLCHHDF